MVLCSNLQPGLTRCTALACSAGRRASPSWALGLRGGRGFAAQIKASARVGKSRKQQGADVPLIRNIGIFAHIDAGKTTTTERLLLIGREIASPGNVDDGTTVMDFMPQERERGITIRAASAQVHWRNHQINVIDTPGHVDFAAEVERAVRVLDGAILVVDGARGVQPQTLKVWNVITKMGLPRLVFVNKLDREGASFEQAVESVVEKLKGTTFVCVQSVVEGSINAGGLIQGIGDVLTQRAFRFSGQHNLSVEEMEQDQHLAADLKAKRQALLEAVAEVDEETADKYLSGQAVSTEDFVDGLRRATLSTQVTPVLAGSALKGIGVHMLMDAVLAFLPAPTERPQPARQHFELSHKGKSKGPARKGAVHGHAAPTVVPTAVVIRASIDGKLGRTTTVRVYEGTLRKGLTLFNGTQKLDEKSISNIYYVQANELQPVNELSEGSIGVLTGPASARAGDTLHTRDPRPFELQGFQIPTTPVCFAPFSVDTVKEEHDLKSALEILELEDPSVGHVEDELTGQLLVSGSGELHLSVVLDRLRTDFGLIAHMGKLAVAMSQTPEQEVSGSKTHTITNQAGMALTVSMGMRIVPKPMLEPETDSRTWLKWEENEVDIAVKVPSDPRYDAPPAAAVEAIREAVHSVLTTSPVRGGRKGNMRVIGCEVFVDEILWSPAQSSAGAARACAAHLARELLLQSSMKVLEPVMEMELAVEQEYVGAIMNELHTTRRVAVREVSDGGQGVAAVSGTVPMSRLDGFASVVRTLSRGSAQLSLDRAGYHEVDSITAAQH
mmetsp:Transcript_33557/g.70905  ORF Transcript_33557/g.70905 Transcript_33557/m.70905 type:complete len:784 (-) Transcript_33557:316-2667(-)